MSSESAKSSSSSSILDMDPFIIVKGSDEHVVNVKTKPNGVVGKSTLLCAFQLEDGVPIGLFKGDKALRTRQEDCDGLVFILGDDWEGAKFELIWDQGRRSRPATHAQDARPNSPYPELPMAPVPMASSVERWMFYLYDAKNKLKSAAICVHARFCVTFRHGNHKQIKLGDIKTIYGAHIEAVNAQGQINEQDGIKVRVVAIKEELDFILLESESGVIVDSGPPLANAQKSEPFILLGFGNEEQTLTCLSGIVYSVCGFFTSFVGDPEAEVLGPFILGTGQSSDGDSGGGCWGLNGLIGMNHSILSMLPTSHEIAIAKAATYSPKNVISPAQAFKTAMAELYREKLEQKAASPPKKKHRNEINMQLVGTPLE